MLPLFFANSSWVRHKYVTFGFLVLSFLMIGGCIVAALVVIITVRTSVVPRSALNLSSRALRDTNKASWTLTCRRCASSLSS